MKCGFVVAAMAMGMGVQAQERTLWQLGWDRPTPAQMRTHFRSFEGSAINGVGLVFALDQVPNRPFAETFSQTNWDPAWFESGIADLAWLSQQPNNPLNSNLLIVNVNPGDVDWFDDAGWAAIKQHFRLAAQIVRRGKLDGIAFDPEPYIQPHGAFAYSKQPQKSTKTFAEYQAKVKVRAAEIMTVMAEEAPNMKILCLHWLNSVNAAPMADGLWKPTIGQQFDLLPAWAQGWVETMPTTMRMIDGNENSYLFNDPLPFLKTSQRIRRDNARFFPAHLRAKFSQVTRVSHAIYLDAYVNPPGGTWYVDGLGGPRVRRVGANLHAAYDSGDGYAWLWGEKSKFWPSGKAATTWEQALPGLGDTMLAAKSPHLFATRALRKSCQELLVCASTPILEFLAISKFDWDRRCRSGWSDFGRCEWRMLGASDPMRSRALLCRFRQNVPCWRMRTPCDGALAKS
jgi:hypothetical protein